MESIDLHTAEQLRMYFMLSLGKRQTNIELYNICGYFYLIFKTLPPLQKTLPHQILYKNAQFFPYYFATVEM